MITEYLYAADQIKTGMFSMAKQQQLQKWLQVTTVLVARSHIAAASCE